LAGSGTNSASNRALLTLRDRILPETLGRVPQVSYAVTGSTAQNYDDIAALRTRTPLVLGVVAVLAFVLLLVAFRSVAIPLVSISLNLLSVGAAYGLITLVFQDGHLAGPLGFTRYGGIVPWIPLFIFVFLFGLSMDYHVFILSRIRELRARGASTRDAVVGGIASSAGVVTSAAVIMVAVFSVFATLSLIQLKTLGVGLAAAVLIDATVVRGVLLPACPGSYCGWLCVPSSCPASRAAAARTSQPAITLIRCRALQQAIRSTRGARGRRAAGGRDGGLAPACCGSPCGGAGGGVRTPGRAGSSSSRIVPHGIGCG